MRSTESSVEREDPEFKVDLRIQGIALDVNPEDEEEMGQIHKVGEKIRIGYCMTSIIEDLEKPEKSIKFSEESSRTIHELGNIECHEMGEISRTVHCHSCLKHILEGLIFCSCGICLRADEEQTQRIKGRFEAMIVPCYLARVKYSRGKRKQRISMAKRPLESNGRPKRSKKEQTRFYRALMTE